MPRVVAVAPVLPPHTYRQSEISAVIGPLLTDVPERVAALGRLHAASGVRTRHLALPLDAYAHLTSFDAANDLFASVGLELATRAISTALADSGLTPEDVDHLMFTTVTGVGAPSLDAAVATRLGMRPDVVRVPSFGLGCAGGAAGLGRLHDHLTGHRDQVAVLLSVELCSLTVQHGDDRAANLVASGLFGDGAAAVVMVGDDHPAARRNPRAPSTLAASSHLVPGTHEELGWDVGRSGFRIVLAPGLPALVQRTLRGPVDRLLEAHDLKVRDVGSWVVHAGGPRILEAVQQALDLDADQLRVSYEVLSATGNLSSASVLHVLAETIRRGPPPGSWGMLMAFGPGVSTDLLLLRSPEEA